MSKPTNLPKKARLRPNKKQFLNGPTLTNAEKKRLNQEYQNRNRVVLETDVYQKNPIQGRKITTVKQVNMVKYNKAEGDRANIMIVAPLQPNAVEFMPIAVISNALGMGFANTPSVPIYWAYYAFLNDLTAILGGMISPLNSRLAYQNSIFASMLPKTIPFKTGTLSFSWTGVDAVLPQNFLTLRLYFYYLYVPSAGISPGGYVIQVPPSNPSTVADAVVVLSNLNAQIADDRISFLKYKTDINFTAAYRKTVQRFVKLPLIMDQGIVRLLERMLQ